MRKTHMEASAIVDDFSKRFLDYFLFIDCMSSVAISNILFVDNNASCHMTWCKEFFTRL
jgi:hypothetical protein